MIGWLRKHAAMAVVAMDLLILPGIWLGRIVVELMFRQGKPCLWTYFGAQCATCGGTHCIQSFLNGQFTDAFRWNPLVFCWILIGIITLVLLNAMVLLRQRWAEKILRAVYSMPGFFTLVGSYLLFAFLRNVPLFFN